MTCSFRTDRALRDEAFGHGGIRSYAENQAHAAPVRLLFHSVVPWSAENIMPPGGFCVFGTRRFSHYLFRRCMVFPASISGFMPQFRCCLPP